ncbi:MAG: ribosome maturation factor RimM, partial [Gammaproteobacteria bacterium]
ADERILGRVQSLIATGSNDVLVVQGERERLIPFIRGQVIKNVDLATRVIRVDWDPDF